MTSIANAVANFPWVADAAGGSCGGGLHDPGLGCDTFVVSADAHCMLVGSCPVSVPAAPDAAFFLHAARGEYLEKMTLGPIDR